MERTHAIGRRKTSVARVYLQPGKGNIVVNKKDLYQFDRFIDKLLKIDTHEVKIIEDFTDLDANSVSDDIVENSEDTITLLNKYVDELPVDLNKNRLKNEIRTLYTEAQDLDI